MERVVNNWRCGRCDTWLNAEQDFFWAFRIRHIRMPRNFLGLADMEAPL